MSFSEKLQKLRKENKLSQEQLANMLDVTRQSVSKWESGTTYPEMDKLITMCKIFKCSLDDLTNDEINDIKFESKKTNQFNNVIDSILEIIEKTVKIFKVMSLKQTIKCIFSLFVLGLFLLLFRIPFDIFANGIYNVLSSLGRPVVENFIYGILNFVIDIIYFILYITLFLYIYKLAYLDKYEIVKEEKNKTDNPVKIIVEEKKEKTKEKETTYITNNQTTNNALFSILGKIIMSFIKFLTACFTIPLIIIVLTLFVILAIVIYLLFEGVIYIGVILGIVFALTMGILFLEIAIEFIFNKPSLFKRLLWTFIISLGGLGIAGGILTLEISNTNYISELPETLESETLTQEFKMNDEMVLGNELSWIYKYHDFYYYYYIDINYIKDEVLQETIKLEMTYNKDFIKADFLEKDNAIGIQAYADDDFNKVKKLINLFIENLSNKEIYNYNKINYITLNVYTSSKNIETLRQNENNLQVNNYREEYEHEKEQYEQTINDYENRLENKEEEISELQEQITVIQDENIELKSTLEEYKEKISSLLE